MTGAAGADKIPAGTTSGAPQVLLAHHLKQLKLPTVLREYDKVARDCARDGVDHPRYLLRLVELELIEPELFFRFDPTVADRLAQHVLNGAAAINTRPVRGESPT